MSRSSSEAEYRVLATTTCELQWLLSLLKDMKVLSTKLTVLYGDNQSAIHIDANHVFHEITKHLKINCHIMRKKLEYSNYRQCHLPTYNL